MKPLIIANWKMNPRTLEEAQELFDAVARGVESIEEVDVVICPPFLYVSSVNGHNSGVQLGAQDCFWEQEGAFTGEVSSEMLKHAGCSYIILGHSERKNYLNETPEMINKKLKTTLAAQLTPIVCIGEKERGEGARGMIEEEMKAILQGIDKDAMQKIILTYEPEWAISTNENAEAAEPSDCKNAVAFMRSVLTSMFDEEVAKATPILYGGSVDSANIKESLDEGEADGALVGGASLDEEEFTQLVRNAVS